jgi:hypothetical protein
MLAALAPAAGAAGPDNFSAALPLTYGNAVADSNSTAGIENPEVFTLNDAGGNGCLTNGSFGTTGQKTARTVWYTVPGDSGTLTVTTVDSTIDTMLAAFRDGTTFAGCNDDRRLPAGTVTRVLASELRLPAAAGHTYYLQLGSSCFNACGTVAGGSYVIGAYRQPANDTRAGAKAIAVGDQASYSNLGAIEDAGERLACGSSKFAKTLWYRFHAPSEGNVVFTSTGTNLDSVIAVYSGSSPDFLACNDDPVGGGRSSRVALEVAPGDYFLQVGGYNAASTPVSADDGQFVPGVEFSAGIDHDGDGVKRPPIGADCDDTNAAIHPGADDRPGDGVDQDCANGDRPVDADGDGFPASQDCNDKNHAIHPGAGEVPGNFIDENCDKKTPPGALNPDPQFSLPNNAFSNGARFRPLVVSDVARGYVVKVRCTGGGCPFKTKTRKAKSRRSVRFPEFNGRFLRPKSRVAVYVYLPKRNLLGRYARWTVRAGKQTQRQTSCLKPTKFTKVVRCGSR